MTEETLDTIEILNGLARFKSENSWRIAIPVTLRVGTLRGPTIDYSIDIYREGNLFYCRMGLYPDQDIICPSTGFGFLEQLAEFSTIREKLARPENV